MKAMMGENCREAFVTSISSSQKVRKIAYSKFKIRHKIKIEYNNREHIQTSNSIDCRWLEATIEHSSFLPIEVEIISSS